MRLMLLTSGTRGDVEPFAVLARHAAARGHDVRLGLPRDSGVDLAGLDAVELGPDFRWLAQLRGSSPRGALHRLRTQVRPGLGEMLTAAVRETLDFAPDVVVHHPLVLTAPAVADALRVPRVLGELVPVATPSHELPAPGTPRAVLAALARLPDHDGRWTRATYAVPRLGARVLRGEVDRACSQLPGAHPSAHPARSRATLLGVSRYLLPPPSDWPARVHLTGAWQDAPGRALLDPAVARFVAGGPCLVASFGSMAAGDPRVRARTVVGTARAHGLRTLLLTGWGGLQLPEDAQGEDVLAVPAAPLSEVLPHVVVAVHHGGSGTAHTVARAGVPSVVVPFLVDQDFWGRQVHRLGLGAEPIPPRRLSRGLLGRAVEDALGCSDRARRTGRLMAEEHGPDAALEVLTGL